MTDAEILAAAAAIRGRIPSDAKKAAARDNLAKARAAKQGRPMSQETRDKLSAAAKKRWAKKEDTK